MVSLSFIILFYFVSGEFMRRSDDGTGGKIKLSLEEVRHSVSSRGMFLM